MSFGFDDGRWLVWLVEVRGLRRGEFAPIADLFRNSALAVVAAPVRDAVRLRANIREEDVQLDRLRTPPDVARARQAGASPDFSPLIRQGVSSPLDQQAAP